MKIMRCLVVIGLMAMRNFAAAADNEIVCELNPTSAVPRNETGSFVKLRSGRIVYYYGQLYGGDYDYSAGRIAEIHSDDGGRSWSEPRLVIENGKNLNLMCVSALRLKSGKIALSYCRKRSEIDVDTCIRLSDDEGATWSEEKEVSQAADNIYGRNDSMIQTACGRIILPLEFNRVIGREDDGIRGTGDRGAILWVYSDDDGKNWEESPTWWTLPCIKADGTLDGDGLAEPTMVELRDGTLLTWARSAEGCQFLLRSYDTTGSRTGNPLWVRAPEPSEIKSPAAPAVVKRLPDSDLLLAVYDDHSGRFPFPKGDSGNRPWHRTPLVAAISADNGQTWPRRTVLEGGLAGNFCYPATYFVDAKTVLIAYNAEDAQYPQHLGRLRIHLVSVPFLLGAPEK